MKRMHAVVCAGIGALASTGHAAGEVKDESIVIFDQAEVRWIPDAPEIQPRDGYDSIGNGQIIQTTVQLPMAPSNQRDSRRMRLVLRVEPVAREEEGRRMLGDPWTRLGHVYVARPGANGDEEPQFVELMRVTTGFGGEASFTADVTSFAPLLDGQTTFRCKVSTWSDPAWRVSLRLDLTDSEAGYRRPKFVAPLWSDVRMTSESNRLTASVTIPNGLALPRLLFTSTGHGRMQEFRTATHILRVDGREVARWRPWREDGGTRHSLNPASRRSNIDGRELWSSDIDRAGWMPGSIVDPLIVPVPELTPGEHTIELEVIGIQAPDPEGGPGGGGGYWIVTTVVVSDEPWP